MVFVFGEKKFKTIKSLTTALREILRDPEEERIDGEQEFLLAVASHYDKLAGEEVKSVTIGLDETWATPCFVFQVGGSSEGIQCSLQGMAQCAIRK